MEPKVTQGSTSHDSKASFAMLKELLEIGLPIEQLQASNRLDLEFECIEIQSRDSFPGAV
jgi:hypothetical protein